MNSLATGCVITQSDTMHQQLSTIPCPEAKVYRTLIFSYRIFSLDMIWVLFFERNLNLIN
jgi:hypothetical protein